jgi:hypothetical protein
MRHILAGVSATRKAALLCAVTALMTVVFAASASADNGAQKVNFFDHPAITCNGNAGGVADDSFAVIKSNGDGTVSAEVALKNAAPNATYVVDLIQSNCSNQNFATLTTNDQGNGNVHLTEQQTSNDASVSVFEFSPAPFGDVQQTPDVIFGS